VVTALLLIVSNVFMTMAWYGHLKFKETALWKVVVISWLIAGVEYCFAVPANRIGHNAGMSAASLKILQEAITLVVFALFSITVLGEKMKWNHIVGFALVMAAVFVVSYEWN